MIRVLVVVAVIVLAALLVAGAVLLWRRRAARRKAPDPSLAAALTLRDSFARARKLSTAATAGRGAGHEAPRYLLLGPEGAGKTTLLRAAGLKVRPGPAAGPVGDPARCQLWIFEQGLVVDTAGALVQPLGDRAPDERMYRAVLAAMREDRPERPMDGLVLAIPCGDLLPDVATPEERRRRADALRERLALAQSELGLRAPVYVLVTQCDRLAGFAELAGEIDPLLRQSILGWSNPRPLDAGVVTDWVDEAFDSVGRALLEEQARRFVSDRPLTGANDFFLFPEELLGLADALRAYVGAIFLPDDDADPLMLRGIYFCGQAEPAAALEGQLARTPSPGFVEPAPGAPAEAGVPSAVERPLVFARELFERKIFPEANLARPGRTALRRRARGILALRIATAVFALLFGGLLAIESSRLERETASLQPFLQDLASDLLRMKLEDPHADPTGAVRMERSIRLFKGMGDFKTDRLRSVLIPGSWPSDVDDRIEDAIKVGYRKVILDAFRAGLETRTAPLFTGRQARSAPPEQPATTNLEKTPEFIVLEGWLRDVSALEANINRFDALAAGPLEEESSGDADARFQGVTDLADYLFRHKLEPAEADAYHRRALRDLPRALPFGIEPYRPIGRARSDQLFGELFKRMSWTLNEAALRDDIEALKAGLNALDKDGPEYTTPKLGDLLGAIVRTADHLAAPRLAWVATEDLPPAPGVARLLDAVKVSRILGPDSYVVVKDDGEMRLALLKTYLATAETSLSGPLLARKEGAVQMELSPFISGLKPPSEALLRQGFVAQNDEKDPVPADLDDARLTWDTGALKEAVKLLKEYEEFVQKDGFLPFPEQVRGTLEALGERNLKANALSAVGKAARREFAPPSSEARLIEIVRADVASLALASESLREILASSERLRLDDVRDRVRGLLRAQGARLLALSTRVLQADGLYEVRNGSFAWWNGEGTPAFEAFGVADAARLAEYVIAQRGRTDTLSKALAEPVLVLLESAEVGAETQHVEGMKFWDQIATSLRKYDEKKPGNSVSAIENFLLTDLPSITFENCIPALDKLPIDVTAGDYFTQRRRRVRGLLRDRCAALATEDIRVKYPRLRRAFNRSLADRFPFAKLEPGVRHEDAPPEAVRDFVATTAEFRRRYRSVLAMRGDEGARSVVRFLDRMEKVRAFLEPMWAQGESASEGAFDTTVEFRVNQGQEVEGNQIAEWTMRFVEDTLTLDGEKSTTRWRIGDAVRLQLRWAKNSPDVPSIEQDPGTLVKDRSAIFDEKGTWALLRIIAAHRSTLSESESKLDASSNLLMFVVYTVPDPAGGFISPAGAAGGIARVFLRVGLTGSDKDKPLKYPDFPTGAPLLDRE